MKETTEAMSRGLGKAVLELRRRMHWVQAELARQIGMHGSGGHSMSAPTVQMISAWEHGEHAPSHEYRGALARIAVKHKVTKDLAETFRAPRVAWRLVGRVKLGKEGE
jgi:transcriptional regulator with XRE-family HTH domain